MLFRKPVQLLIIAVVVLATGVVSLPGFLSLNFPIVDNSIKFIALFAIGAAVISTVCKMSPLIVGAGLIVTVTVACGQVWPLLTVLLFSVSSTLLGHKILGRWKPGEWSLHLLLGAGILGTMVGLAAHFPINYPASYTALLSLPFLINWQHVRSLILQLCQAVATDQSPSIVARTLDLAVCSLAALYVVIAFMPEVGHDALAMHLFIPAHLLERHQWGFDVDTYIWALWPMLGDWIYSLVYMLAGETAARLTNTFFILIVAWQIREFVIWAGGSRGQSRWAVLIFLSTPLVFSEATSLFIESVWTAFTLAAIFSILRMSDGTQNHREGFVNLVLAGTLLGFAIATKAVTLSILPVLLISMLFQHKAWAKRGLVPWLLVGTLLFLIAGAIPYAFSWYITGNPIFPFFNTVFHSSRFPLSDFQAPALFDKGFSWKTLYAMTFASERFIEGRAGSAGFQWLLIPAVAVILLFRNHRRALGILLIGIGAMIATYYSTAYLRYVFPSFAIVCAVIVLPFSHTPKLIKILGGALGGLLVFFNIWFIQSSTYYGQLLPDAVLSKQGRDDYLNDHMPILKLVEILNILNSSQRPVAVFASPLVAGLKSDALYASWYNMRWLADVDSVKTERQLSELFRQRKVDWLIIDPTRLTAEKLQLLLHISLPVVTLSGIELRRYNDTTRYTLEMLKNSELLSAEGWSLASPLTYDDSQKIFSVNVKEPATQAVTVEAGRSYKNSVSVRCSAGVTQGRIQVNWHDAQGAFISTNIQVYTCSSDWQSHEMTVTAPAQATTAIIYASGHTEEPLVFKSVSFKQ
ncbi:phospholipid carrier-dependent glycosyltransferase [Pseudomonas marginalis]|uniref:phospholipid carrier-dependent glycosyltransferase n=1 Tax=Pseudomonas marginalis TaxID=298 RepID=UPI0005FBEC27|nr:phospholipid carrier-dependent glycosyltransferase [Pseudomonas marginalis]KJZ55932.1 glycosyl transferase [Pseudomonas marginalis]KJZ58711.1 glycosyl transferase [Pseudomonas marginalis]